MLLQHLYLAPFPSLLTACDLEKSATFDNKVKSQAAMCTYQFDKPGFYLTLAAKEPD